MTVKRRQFLKAGAFAAAGGTTLGTNLAAPARAEAPPAVQWRLTSSFPKALDILFGTAQIFANYVAEATNNAFQIQVFPAGEIAPGLQALDTVASGAVECAHTPAGFYAAKDPTLAFGGGVPFGLNQRQQQAWWTQGGGSALVNEAFKKQNAVCMPMGCGGAQIVGWSRKELSTAEDFSGIKIRIGGMAGQVLARLGALPQQLNRHEIAGALESGAIDAVSFASPYDDEKLGLARVAKYCYTPGWWDSSTTLQLMVNLDAWAKLPKPYQVIVMHASEAAHAWMLAKYDALNPPALKRLVAGGTIVKPFPAAVLEAGLKAAGEHYAEIAGQNALFKKTLEQMTAFRSEQVAWLQTSDYALDTFMLGPRSKG